MKILNSFKVENGKPIIYSKESAKRFIEQCKQPQNFKIDLGKKGKGFIRIADGKVEVYETNVCGVFEMDYHLWSWTGEEAVTMLYRLRKYINIIFKMR